MAALLAATRLLLSFLACRNHVSERADVAWGDADLLQQRVDQRRLRAGGDVTVWALSTGGRRLEEVAARSDGNALVVPLNVDHEGAARMLYEIARGD